MGVLDEIQKNTITAKLAAVDPVAAEPQTGPVVSPQPVPPPPLDCAAKDSLIARIRQTYPAAGPTPASPPDAKLAPFVTAVWEPPGFRGQNDPGGYFFDESVSQSERREIVAEMETWDRIDARKKREVENPKRKFHREVSS